MIDRAQLAEGLHASLRKFSDTDQSVLLWNLVHIVPDFVWAWWIEAVAERLDKGASLGTAFMDIETAEARQGLSNQGTTIAAATVLIFAFRLIDRATLSDLELALGEVLNAR